MRRATNVRSGGSLYFMAMNIPAVDDHGVWSIGVQYANASDLVKVLDPHIPYVVIEGHSPATPGWLTLPVPMTSDPKSVRIRNVRSIRFDLLVSPDVAVGMGLQLDSADAGGVFIWQARLPPPAYLSLSQKTAQARGAAMNAVDVTLLIDLPHRSETAVISSLKRTILEEATGRLGLLVVDNKTR